MTDTLAITLEQLAKRMAYSIRQPNDVSVDADDYWTHTSEAAQHSWKTVARVVVVDAPEELSEEEIAKIIYPSMQWLSATLMRKASLPELAEGGNSLVQEECRRAARRIIGATP